MTWTLIYILAGAVHVVPNLPDQRACVAAWLSVRYGGATAPMCLPGDGREA